MTREQKEAVFGLLSSDYQGILSNASTVLNSNQATLNEYIGLLKETGFLDSLEKIDSLPTKGDLTSRSERLLDFLDDVWRYEQDLELREMAGEVYGRIHEYSIQY